MVFESYSLVGGRCEYGHELGWHRAKNGGHYYRHRDFFWVHWEIGDAKPCHIKFHVESPKMEIDSGLNRIKQEMVADFSTATFEHLAKKCGFEYKRGSRIKVEDIQRYKCTEAFRIIVKPEQCQSTHRTNIETVNAAMRQGVIEVLERFTARLDHHFPPEREVKSA